MATNRQPEVASWDKLFVPSDGTQKNIIEWNVNAGMLCTNESFSLRTPVMTWPSEVDLTTNQQSVSLCKQAQH